MYLLVEFTDNKDLGLIPDNWLDGTSCAVWPPFKSTSRLTKAVISKDPPTDSWQSYPIRVLYKHESYDKVRSKLKRAEVESDLQTDVETQNAEHAEHSRPVRRRRSPSRYSSSESSDEGRTPLKVKKAKSTNLNLVMPVSLPSPPVAAPPVLAPPATYSTKAFQLSSPPPLAQAVLFTASSPTPSPGDIPLGRRPVASPTPHRSPMTSPTHGRSPMASTSGRPPMSKTSSRPSVASPTSAVGTILARDVRFFTILEKMREEQQNQTNMLSTILSKIGDGDEAIPEDIVFPLMTVEEMGGFNEKVADKTTEKLVVSHLASIGGSSIENMASRILKYVVSNQLAQKYNWTGSKEKAPFRPPSLQIAHLVKRAVRRSFRMVTDTEIEACRKSFLKCARDRDGGRQKRMKKVVPAARSPNTSDSDDAM